MDVRNDQEKVQESRATRRDWCGCDWFEWRRSWSVEGEGRVDGYEGASEVWRALFGGWPLEED